MLRIVATYLSKPIARLLTRTLPLDDPWQRFALTVPLRVYGLGARSAFRWYFQGRSAVDVQSIEEIQAWLLGCQYVRDPDLFQEADFWQHPCTFEHLRKGDCEDFSLWAWRKLVELGYQAEFVAGRCVQPGSPMAGHTWVLFERDGRTYLFDTSIRPAGLMIRPLDAVRREYLPEASVDGAFTRYVYAGYFLQRRRQSPAREAAMTTLPQAG